MAVETPPEWVPVQDYGIDMLRNMLSVKDEGKVRILPCNASLKETKSADITVLTGPIIVIREDGFSGLLQLAEESILNLVQDCSVRPLNHLCVVEQDNGNGIYVEDVHDSFELLPRGRLSLNPQRMIDWEWQRTSQGIIRIFDNLVSLIGQTKEKSPAEFESLPILVRPSVLDRFIKICKDTGTDLSYISTRQILGLPIVKGILF